MSDVDATLIGRPIADKPNLALWFVIWAWPLVIALAWVTPPWQNPDEVNHMMRAVQIAHGGLAGFRQNGSAGGLSDLAIADAAQPFVDDSGSGHDHRIKLSDLAKSDQVGWHRRLCFFAFPNTAQYPPFFYLPAGLVYRVARHFDVGVDRTLYAARMVNASLYVWGCFLALSMARGRKAILAALLMLPMSLAVAAAVNQDALLFASMALAVALMDRIADEDRDARRWEIVAIAALLALVGLARPPYAGFLLALFAYAPKRAALRVGVPAGLAVIGWSLYCAADVSVNMGAGNVGQQWAFLRGHLDQIGTIVTTTIARDGESYRNEFVGVLGWLDTPLPGLYIDVVLAILGALLLTNACRWRKPAYSLGGGCFALIGIFTVEYLTWTVPGSTAIEGVQGRYLIPVAMMLLLALPGPWRPHIWLPRLQTGLLALLGLITPLIMLHALILRYDIAFQ